MARTGSRGTRATASSSRRKHRGSSIPDVPDVYQELLENAVSSSPGTFEHERPLKRRRVAGRLVVSQDGQDKSAQKQEAGSETAGDTEVDIDVTQPSKLRQQVVYDNSEDSAGSDMAWEEVDLRDIVKNEDTTPEPEELTLVLGGNKDPTSRTPAQRRKPVSAEERKLRLEIHKMHLLSLLVHVHLRNHWCNDHETQKVLRKLLSKKTLSYLDDDEGQSQFQRSRSFMEGLEQASEVFRSNFKVTARGMSRSYWAEDAEHLAETDIPLDIDLPIQKSDFRATATKLQASRDVGAQLFCSILRSAGVEARLVCSLQPLPFTATIKGTTPVKPKPAFTVSYLDTRIGISDDESGADVGSDTSIRTAGSTSTNGAVSRIKSRLATRIGRSQPISLDVEIATPPPTVAKPHRKPIRESPYPVYWVEAFNAAIQKWVPVDPLVTKTIAKPSKFEPPASDIENNMAYVIAFEEDGSARDVTRRYAKAYNAKTRRARVEITNGGEKWWRRVIRMYKRLYELDRDQVEDAELTAKEATEGMPRNVQDFKNHPYYALERHLRRNEVIHPKREVGKVTAGKSSADSGKSLESVYRRRDVHMVKSADSWYRLGREIKTGEQPLKRVQPRRRRDVVSEEELSGDEDNAGTGMYAAFQTITYEAPPVVRGLIPKNAYGNLDVYVSSMVPPGGVHIVHADTARAARLIGIDYADAVTGFEFKGRFGTAVIKGAVVAKEFQEAVEEVISAFEYEREEAEENRRTLEALRMWRRLLAGLRIRERIAGYEIEGERDAIQQEMQLVDEDMEEDDDAGGFLPDRDDEGGAEPTAGHSFQSLPNQDYEDGGGFMAEASDDGSQVVEYSARRSTVGTNINKSVTPVYTGGGGFLEDEEMNDDDLDDKDGEDAMREVGFLGRANTDIFEKHPRASMNSDLVKKETPVVRQDTPIINVEPSPPPEFPYELDEGDFAEARLLQQIHESENQEDTSLQEDATKEHEKDQSPGLAPPTADDPAPVVSGRLHIKTPVQDTEEAEDSVKAEPKLAEPDPLDEAEVSDAESEISEGSLLSHDPSDEDAEPEWMSRFE
ncbi:hypothetical protein MMC11_008027 [Xylographa trunciseda]|nr:hypothetical protein [Xylographa trunciseda]